MPKITDDRPAHIGSDAPADNEQPARQQAIKQIRARRRFKISTAAAAVGVTLLVPIWATTEYRNAGGWPTHGFSQSSGNKVWNIWIIYPLGGRGGCCRMNAATTWRTDDRGWNVSGVPFLV